MKEPVCLGTCEHMLCRSCAGPRAGDGCTVCHSPAWVKDIQINRQLSNITQLFCSLESLLNPIENSDSSLAEKQTQLESPLLKHKRNFKIWFSPRSRKVRCMVEKPSEVTVPGSGSSGETASAQPDAITTQCKDLSVFNFSSQDSGSSCPETCNTDNRNGKKRSAKNAANRKPAVRRANQATHKQTKQKKKKKNLEAINQQWGISEEEEVLREGEQACVEGEQRSSKRVSFLSPGVSSEEPQPKGPQGNPSVLSPSRSILRQSLSGGSITMLPEDQAQPGQSMLASPFELDTLFANDPKPSERTEKQDNASPRKPTPKRSRVDEKEATSERTPKRPRASPGRRRRSAGRTAPALLDPPSLTSPRRDKSAKSPREERGDSPSCPSTAGTKSPRASGGRPASGSPAIMKRNHKGETPLHLAAIKGDVETATELLDQGADPNLKDNAGWTPLHEACNLGHQAVAEVLVLRGALLNTPGYENDSPLHDAVRNGHLAIAKLLLHHGASQNVLNLYGKRPADYALSLEMHEIFQVATEGPHPAITPISPSASLSMVSDSVRSDEPAVLLASKLSQPQQQQLAKLGQLLGVKRAEAFSGSVSHVVVPDGPMPTTLSTLLGVLAGCWVLRYSWVEACLQAGKWMPETEHEAGEGPQRSRINRCSLLPPLFDGCFFFLLGSFKTPPKEGLAELLREGGGQLLSRQPKPDSDVTQTLSAAAYHSSPGSDQALCTQYILYDPRGAHKPAAVRRGKVWSAPSTWLIDCIAAFRLLPVPESQA
ncbi:BRCA1-associated RING domain protein 1 [Centroberyx affinis]|uniref:BRCA1-associated RING domain protein 1 n=1 Tax=Centroberyx affinis TaxID=166261 RepID=UPI003A5B9DE2